MKIKNKQKIFLSILIVVMFFVFLFIIIKNSNNKIIAEIQPSRLPEKDCEWRRFENKNINFYFLYQYCNSNSDVLYFKQDGNRIMEVLQDKNNKKDSYPVVEIFNRNPKETTSETFKKIFISKLDNYSSKHCIVVPSLISGNSEEVVRLTIKPDREYSQQLANAQKATSDVPNPPCGNYGYLPDSESYFEFHRNNPNMFIWVLYGQDQYPLFDEESFRF